MVTLKNILVATDFGDTSAAALTYGRELARAFGARLHLAHMVEDIMVYYSPESGFAAAAEIQQNLEAAARRELQAVITDHDRKTLQIEPVVRSCFNIADGIVDYARNNAIDLIVTGTHGRGAIKHLMLGSVAERVVRAAPCPVLTVRPHERDFVVAELQGALAAAAIH